MGQTAHFVPALGRVLLAVCIFLTGGGVSAVENLPPGSKLFVQSDGPVNIQFIGGTSAIFDNELYLGSTGNPMLFASGSSALYDTKSLGSFTAGVELVFLDRVTDTDTNTVNVFSIGPASRNPDSLVHADIGQLSAFDLAAFEQTIEPKIEPNTLLRDGTNPVTIVGFEDTFNLTDTDFNDMVFLVTNVGPTQPIPEPEMFALMCVGLGLVGWSARRRMRAGAGAARLP